MIAKKMAVLLLRIILFTGLITAILGILGCGFNIDYDSYALVYGISDYLPAAVKDLNYCHLDAQDMEALLQSRGFSVTSRTDDPGFGTTNVTRANIESDISSVADQARPEDLFLFFFSGHGSFIPVSGTEPPESDIYDEAIVLNESGALYEMTDDELAALIRQIPCQRKVVIIDACYSGGIIGNSLEIDRIPPDYDEDISRPGGVLESAITLYANFTDETADISPYDALVISAAGEMESSWESSDYNNGVFTYYLLEAAGKGDSNRDGYLTVVEAFSYARGKINVVWNLQPPYYQFSPHISGGPVDFVLFPVP